MGSFRVHQEVTCVDGDGRYGWVNVRILRMLPIPQGRLLDVEGWWNLLGELVSSGRNFF